MLSRRLLQAVEGAGLLEKVYNHPFNLGLYQGTLSRPVFYKFLMQDKIYLEALATVLRKAARRLSNTKQRDLLYQLAEYDLVNQKKIHEEYQLPKDSLHFFSKVEKPMPAVTNYIRYLNKNVKSEPIHIAVASLIPCFYLYAKLGLQIRKQGIGENHLFRTWLKTYMKQTFIDSSTDIIQLADTLALDLKESELEAMLEAILISIQHELSIWDDSFVEEKQTRHFLSFSE